MNDTIRELTMDKMDCGGIQWQNYNPDNDPNLQQSSEAGMELLMSKLKESQDKPATIITGGKTEVIENSGNVQMSLQAKLEEKIKKSQMKKKQTSSECKKLEENFAKQRKTRFTSKDEKKFEDICGFVPDAEYMFGLITSLQIMREEEEKNWKMPGMALKMELVDWPVINKCIGRKSVLNKQFNCFARTDMIWNKASCFKNGCIYHGEDCFYCKEAIENMKSTQVAIDQLSDGKGECDISTKKRQACKGYNKDDGENLAKNMMMLQMMSNPTMGIMLEKKNQSKCQKLGCCYERNDKKMIMQMMMMNNNAASMQPAVPQTTMNPMMALLGGGSGSSSNMNNMMAMLSGGSSSNDMMSMLGGGSSNPMMTMLGGQTSSMDPLQMLLSGQTGSSNSFNALSGLGGYGLSSSSGSSSDAMMMSMMMGGNPMNSLLMKKLEEDDEFTCFSPIDFEHTDDHECIPDISQNECGVALEDATEHPWNVIFEGPNGNRCGGALICSSWILTTASCLSSLAEDVKDIQAFADITNGTDLTSATPLTIRQVQKHPMYNTVSYGRHRLLHDVAAVQINSISNMPICLPSKSSKNPDVNDEVNTFSYGSIDSTGSFQAEMKRSTFNLLAAKVCEDNYGSVDFSSSLCAEKGSDASNTENPVCHNDKGSVVANFVSGNYKIVGLIAGGPDNCILTSTTPAVFLSVRKDLQWILDVTNDCCQATMF
ncbi:unnamed protein product [Oikopleura dioica]|uniref:Peptidase S1 domain-containing protein n=1 Tax=Oikopleura dioica TaxID=34765 RepID=E4XF22_OIKDI|nr:unnamed protein product [Oikopleura dioica]